MQDDFGDRMKALEKQYTVASIPANKFMCARIDGKGFSKFTKNLSKPFDPAFSLAMKAAARGILETTPAFMTYVQSDEISVFFSANENPLAEHWFGGKVSKINSVLASTATWYFSKNFVTDKPAFFDCRTWAVDDISEASNVLLWRAQDCIRNSVSSCYRWVANKKKMPNQFEMKKELAAIGYDWDQLDQQLKSGTIFKKDLVMTETEFGYVPRTRIIELHQDFTAMTYEGRKQFMMKPEVEAANAI